MDDDEVFIPFLFNLSRNNNDLDVANKALNYKTSSGKEEHDSTKYVKYEMFPKSEHFLNDQYNALLITSASQNKQKSIPFTFSLYRSSVYEKNNDGAKTRNIKKTALGNIIEKHKQIEIMKENSQTKNILKNSGKIIKSGGDMNYGEISALLYNCGKRKTNYYNHDSGDYNIEKAENKLERSFMNVETRNFKSQLKTDEEKKTRKPIDEISIQQNKNTYLSEKHYLRRTYEDNICSFPKNRTKTVDLLSNNIKYLHSDGRNMISPRMKSKKEQKKIEIREKQEKSANTILDLPPITNDIKNTYSTFHKSLDTRSEDKISKKSYVNSGVQKNTAITKPEENANLMRNKSSRCKANKKAINKVNESNKIATEETSNNCPIKESETFLKSTASIFDCTEKQTSSNNSNITEILKRHSPMKTKTLLSNMQYSNIEICGNIKNVENKHQHIGEPKSPLNVYDTTRFQRNESKANEPNSSSNKISTPLKTSDKIIVSETNSVDQIIDGNNVNFESTKIKTSNCFNNSGDLEENTEPKRKELKPLVHPLAHIDDYKINTKEKLAKFNLGNAMTYALYGASDLSNKVDIKIKNIAKEQLNKAISPQKCERRHFDAIKTNVLNTDQENKLDDMSKFSEDCNLPNKNMPNIDISYNPHYNVHASSLNKEHNTTIEQNCNYSSCSSCGVQTNCHKHSNFLPNTVGNCCPTNFQTVQFQTPSIPGCNQYTGNQYRCPFQHQIPLVLTGFGVVGNINANNFSPEIPQACYLPQTNFPPTMPSLYLAGNGMQHNCYNIIPSIPSNNLPISNDSTSEKMRQLMLLDGDVHYNESRIEEITSPAEDRLLGCKKSIKDDGKIIAEKFSSGRKMAELIYGRQADLSLKDNSINRRYY